LDAAVHWQCTGAHVQKNGIVLNLLFHPATTSGYGTLAQNPATVLKLGKQNKDMARR